MTIYMNAHDGVVTGKTPSLTPALTVTRHLTDHRLIFKRCGHVHAVSSPAAEQRVLGSTPDSRETHLIISKNTAGKQFLTYRMLSCFSFPPIIRVPCVGTKAYPEHFGLHSRSNWFHGV